MTYGVFPSVGPQGPPGPPGPAGGLAAWGSWSHSQTVLVSTGVAPTVATYDTVDVPPVGMALVAGSQITVTDAGLYEFTCSPQVHVQGGTGSVVTFWPRTGAGNVPNSASRVEVGNNHRFGLPFVSYLIQLAAGEYVEFCLHGVGDTPEIFAQAAQAGPPAIPANPSIIVTAKRIA